MVNAIPQGHHSVTPYLIIKDADRAIEFYKKAFDAQETRRIKGPDEKVFHAEIKIGDSFFMLAEEHPEMNHRGPKSMGGSPISLCLYVKNVDASAKKAMQAGAKEVRPVADQFYGDRMGSFEDPFGYIWHIATHKEDISNAEMQKRAAACMPPKNKKKNLQQPPQPQSR